MKRNEEEDEHCTVIAPSLSEWKVSSRYIEPTFTHWTFKFKMKPRRVKAHQKMLRLLVTTDGYIKLLGTRWKLEILHLQQQQE